MQKRQQILLKQIEEKLDSYVPKTDVLYQNLIEAMRYSLLDGGRKRIQFPLLVWNFVSFAEERFQKPCLLRVRWK